MPQTLDQLRAAYQKAVDHPHRAGRLWEELKKYRGDQGVVLAYKASALALKAKHDWNPYNKLNWLNESMNIFREAVKLDSQNIEIRFLRFAIQHYSPEFLNHSQHIDEDKMVILTNFGKYETYELQKDHLKSFFEFFEESKRFSNDELLAIKSFIE
ncbi:MAG: hypothetical protein MRZ79_22230 [Bacteroidia bacterium]|nr:hypothetical protein [Bacteroidia bacterium]